MIFTEKFVIIDLMMTTVICEQIPEVYDYWYWYEIRLQLLERDQCCVYCYTPLSKFTASIDHLVPKSKGGTDEMHNLALCCKGCNNDKKDLLPLDFIMWRLKEHEENKPDRQGSNPPKAQVLPVALLSQTRLQIRI